MKLWLDDIRNPAFHVGPGWTWVKTVAECTDALATREVTDLSLDYDLVPMAYACARCQGGLRCGDHQSGMAVVFWLDENPDRWPARVKVHSANPKGRARMLAALERGRP